jgi:hypothetical protein
VTSAGTAAIAAAVALVLPATSAGKTDVFYSADPEEGSFVFVSANRARNDVSVSANSHGAFVITDAQRIDLGRDRGACDRLGPRSVRCPTADSVDVFLGAGDDRLRVKGRFPVGVDGFGMKGNDDLAGGPASYDTMAGGEARDLVHGGGGGDAVTGGEGKKDRVYGDGGDDNVDVGGFEGGPDSGDFAYGGPGDDSLMASGEREAVLDCGSGLSDSVSLYSTNRSKIRNCEQIGRYPPFER